MSKDYDLDVCHGRDWLSRETYESIKAEIDTWPDWKKQAYGVLKHNYGATYDVSNHQSGCNN